MILADSIKQEIDSAVAKFLARRRPPLEIRSQVDLGYRIQEHHVYLYEIRPHPTHPKNKIEHPVAKASYVQSRNHWRIYWNGGNAAWQAYSPQTTVNKVHDFLEVVVCDPYRCFWS